MKEEALKLADELDALHQYVPTEAPVMIRRLVEELDKQGEPVAWWNGKSKFCSPRDKSWDAKTGGILSFGCNIPLYTTPQTKPLSDDEILNVAFCSEISTVSIENDWGGTVLEFAKAILERAKK